MSNQFDIPQIKMGWLPDYPDFRDYTPEHERVEPMIAQVGLREAEVKLQPSGDLRRWCSPIENQGRLGSCTAQAGVALLEYYERRAFGRHLDASRLFLYKVTRNLLNWTGDTGAFIRTTMGALVLFGAPPEVYWPYTDEQPDFDREPPAFCYAFAQQYQAIRYYRLDPLGTSKDELLNRIKRYIAFGFPPMFGFTVYSSISEASPHGKIPFPEPGERRLGGHAVVAVGYDDEMEIKGETGALLIRNSWGTDWGEDGYGWLPYKYVLTGLAIDWWAILKQEWVNTEQFGF